VRAGRFNDRAVTGQTRAVRTTRFQYRARERFKKTLSLCNSMKRPISA
jgi:hypothetical protein